MDEMTDAIEAFLANGGRIRRFEQGASGNPIVMLDWLKSQGVDAQYIGRSLIRIGRRKTDLAGLQDHVNAMRKAQGLEPFSTSPSSSKAHFCFNTAPSKVKKRRERAA